MNCPFCDNRKSIVLETYRFDDKVRRRRECTACRFRWTTVESLKNIPPCVSQRKTMGTWRRGKR